MVSILPFCLPYYFRGSTGLGSCQFWAWAVSKCWLFFVLVSFLPAQSRTLPLDALVFPPITDLLTGEYLNITTQAQSVAFVLVEQVFETKSNIMSELDDKSNCYSPMEAPRLCLFTFSPRER